MNLIAVPAVSATATEAPTDHSSEAGVLERPVAAVLHPEGLRSEGLQGGQALEPDVLGPCGSWRS
jgi:hypothetical protein